jgi:NAD(P) transhydrogenase
MNAASDSNARSISGMPPRLATAVLNLKGTIDYFIQNTFNYPTLAEAYKIAGLDAWNRMSR